MRVRVAYVLLVVGWCSAASMAQQWASSVSTYQQGTVATGTGAALPSDPTKALGAPDPINGLTIKYPSILSPFSPPFESTQVVDVGQGGLLTLKFAAPIEPRGARQIGVFTMAGLMDVSTTWPMEGKTGVKAETMAHAEYGADRSALVEVGSSAGVFVPLGRVLFSNPTNYFLNAADPYAPIAPDAAQVADFTQPFTGQVSDFDNMNWSGVKSVLNGSAGGTWLPLPASLGIDDVQYIRFSQPLWTLDDGSTDSQLTSRWTTVPPDNAPFVKPADLFIDSVIAMPEPGAMLLISGGLLAVLRRRR